jgi:starch synthase
MVRIVHVAAEHGDLAQAGGLGDVLAGLPPAQVAGGAEVMVILPGYPSAIAELSGDALEGPLVRLPWGPVRFRVHRGRHRGVDIELIDDPALFGRPWLYGPPGGGYSDNPMRFAVFCRAIKAWLDTAHAGAFDVVHSHDWHAGLLPALYRLDPAAPAQVFTVHNLAYQGTMPAAAQALTGVADAQMGLDGVSHHGEINCMKAGVQLADAVTTVSPTYARELLTEAGGWDLAPLFRWRGRDLHGITNGVRTDQPQPPTGERGDRRQALCAELGLEPPRGLLFAMISRLAPQKGVDTFLAALEPLLAEGHRAVMLGTGDAALVARARVLARRAPRRFALVEAFDPALATGIYGAADAICVPSRFEPCGVVQLHAMRHGALPIVRRTGGLVDTVADVADGGWGFVFGPDTVAALGQAMRRAIALRADPAAWSAAVARAMARPVGWEEPARRYLELYSDLLARQR